MEVGLYFSYSINMNLPLALTSFAERSLRSLIHLAQSRWFNFVRYTCYQDLLFVTISQSPTEALAKVEPNEVSGEISRTRARRKGVGHRLWGIVEERSRLTRNHPSSPALKAGQALLEKEGERGRECVFPPFQGGMKGG